MGLLKGAWSGCRRKESHRHQSSGSRPCSDLRRFFSIQIRGKGCDRRMMLAEKWAAKTLASEDASFPGEMR